ncbi:MAG TPA: hypothetical protein VHE30_21285 [Polyangiaceae bacterium]|nr:hypothetical protein [Polyangiaceae bacterium]
MTSLSSSSSRALALAGLLCCLWAWPRIAHADGTPSHCESARLLEQLTEDDRKFLQGICENPPASGWATQFPDAKQQLDRIAARLAPGARWAAALFAHLLPATAFEEEHDELVCAPRDPKKKRAPSGEEAFMDALRQFDRQVRAPPLPGTAPPAFYFDYHGNGCDLRSKGAATANPEEHSVSVLIVAAKRDQVRVIVGGRTPRELRPPPLEGASREFGKNLYFVRIPEGAPYVVTAHLPAPDKEVLPDARPVVLAAKSADDDETIWPVEHPDGCLDVQIAVDEGEKATLFIDGIRTDIHRAGDSTLTDVEWLPLMDHRVVVTGDGQHGAATLVVQDFKAPPTTEAHICQNVRFDLRHRKQADSIGLLAVDTSTCLEAGIDSAKLRAFVVSDLERRGQKPRDLESFGAALEDVTRFRQSLDALRAKPSGADRGAFDTERNLQDAAGELWRQGFGKLLSVQLICSRAGAAGGWDYSIAASAIRLDVLQQRRPDPIRGLDIEGVVRSEIELVGVREQLAQAIDLSFSRLFDLPFIGVEEVPRTLVFHSSLAVTAEARAPETGHRYAAVLQVRALDPFDSRDVCERVEDVGELRAPLRSLDELQSLEGWAEGEITPLELGSTSRRTVLEAYPRSAAPYLLRTRLLEERGEGTYVPVAERYQCTDFSRASVDLELDVGTWVTGPRSTAALDEDYGAFFAFATVGWKQAFWRNFRFGPVAGYSHVKRRGSSPPNWDDLTELSTTPNRQGKTPYSITEDAAYFGIGAEARWSICELSFGTACARGWRRTELTLRGSALFGVHVIDKSSVPADLLHYRGDSSSVIPDVALLASPGVSVVGFSEPWAAHLRFWFGAPRTLDVLGWGGRSPSEASVSSRLVWGFSLGASCAL